jgi:hypothetical protein
VRIKGGVARKIFRSVAEPLEPDYQDSDTSSILLKLCDLANLFNLTLPHLENGILIRLNED